MRTEGEGKERERERKHFDIVLLRQGQPEGGRRPGAWRGGVHVPSLKAGVGGMSGFSQSRRAPYRD